MRNNVYKIRFDTLDHISFHDRIIKQAEWENGNLLLYFDRIDVHRTHPDNNTGKAKQTDNALVCFGNVKATKSQWHDDSKAIANAFGKRKMTGDTSVIVDIDTNEIEIKDMDFLCALDHLDIVSLDTETNTETYICKIEGGSAYDHAQRRTIEFEYSNVCVCFNGFTANAWFDNGVAWDGSAWVS